MSSRGIGLAASLMVLMEGISHAQGVPGQDVHWTCWLGAGSDHHIHCVRESDPVLDKSPDPSRNRYEDEGKRGAFFAEGKAHNLARVVREAQEGYQNLLWSIPLFSTPFDLEDVRLLATSIMCGTDRHCTVTFDRSIVSGQNGPLTLGK